jgi:glycosyltransferase involved in cell wall biosynthesis
MHILIIYQYFGTPAGGWSTRVYELAKRWVEEGARVQVVTSPYYKSDIKASGLISKQQIDGVELIVINSGDSNKLPKWKRAVRALLFALLSTYFALISSANIVLASSGPITVGIPGLAARWFVRKKLVFEVRDLWPRGAIEMNLIRGRIPKRLSLWFERLCYSNSSLVVPCSIGMEADIIARFPHVKTVVIPNGSDVALFGKPATVEYPPYWFEQPKQKIFVYFGSLGVMDACDEIINGLLTLKERSNIHIVFIGDGSEKARLEEMVRKSDLEQHIHFLGLLPKNELVGWLKISVASFVVFKEYPVLATSSPNKMFDSFAAGLPVIQNTTGWIRDLIDEHGCGLNVEPANPVSMATAIKIISQIEAETWNNMSDAAMNLAKYTFNRDLLATQYYSELNKLLLPS